MPRPASSFRVGRVRSYRRNKVWYLCYHEGGKRHRPRVGPDIAAARQLAAQALRHLFATALQDGRVDPLIRNLVMGHAAAGARARGHGLGMTAVYAHSRPDTVRRQLEDALADRPAVVIALGRFRDGRHET